MNLAELTPLQWAMGGAAAFFVGVSKTGVPGAGILMAPLMAFAFAGRLSPGVLLPLLILGDLFAVAWYKRHCDWSRLRDLAPWLAAGLIPGAALLFVVGLDPQWNSLVGRAIALIVITMIAVHLLRKYRGLRLDPTSGVGVALTGIAAGFATTVGNSAGPVTSVYMTAARMSKEVLIGTSAWLYLLINVSKVPIYVALTQIQPLAPMINVFSLTFGAAVAPLVIAGVFLGRKLLNMMSQELFEALVLSLAGVAAIILLIA